MPGGRAPANGGKPAPRALKKRERELIEFLLDALPEGVEAYRMQLEHTLVRRRCPCGCATIDLTVDKEAAEPAPDGMTGILVRGFGPRDCDLFLVTEDGWLASLEIAGGVLEDGPCRRFPPLQECTVGWYHAGPGLAECFEDAYRDPADLTDDEETGDDGEAEAGTAEFTDAGTAEFTEAEPGWWVPGWEGMLMIPMRGQQTAAHDDDGDDDGRAGPAAPEED